MSEAQSALGGASYAGFATIDEAGLRGMVTLRGDLTAPGLQEAVTAITGTDFPAQRAICRRGDHAVAWMSPDEVLLILPYANAGPATAALSGALGGTHHLVLKVSDARATFVISGPKSAEVIAKLAPADMGKLPIGEIRRTRLAQSAVAFWRREDGAMELVTFRSTARYVFNVLCNAARPGSEVDYL